MSDFLYYIRNGIKATDTFFYDDHSVTLRPLSSAELDDAERQAYKFADSKLVKLVMAIRLNDNVMFEQMKEIPPEMYKNIELFYKETNYWIVYYSMKDFQPLDFSIEDVRKMKYVHEMADKIFTMTAAPRKLIQLSLANSEGKELLDIVFRCDIPLVDEAWKLTPMQKTFYDLTSGKKKMEIKTDEDFDTMLYGFSPKKIIEKLRGEL